MRKFLQSVLYLSFHFGEMHCAHKRDIWNCNFNEIHLSELSKCPRERLIMRKYENHIKFQMQFQQTLKWHSFSLSIILFDLFSISTNLSCCLLPRICIAADAHLSWNIVKSERGKKFNQNVNQILIMYGVIIKIWVISYNVFTNQPHNHHIIQRALLDCVVVKIVWLFYDQGLWKIKNEFL